MRLSLCQLFRFCFSQADWNDTDGIYESFLLTLSDLIIQVTHPIPLGFHILFPILHQLFSITHATKSIVNENHRTERCIIPEQVIAQNADKLRIFEKNIALTAFYLFFKSTFRQMPVQFIPDFLNRYSSQSI